MREARRVIVSPIITEKSSSGQMEHNRYTFEVANDANKHEIKAAVEQLFSVHVKQVRTSRLRGKFRRRGVHLGKQPNWKKAVVTLAEGETIEIFEGL
ncbi:MAG: 50S ribosomal protein L23 [Gemmatimonadota bacterium]|nr:MAG: 50S ribosomal protein L23 [Gemmatimonadota bacterium]